MSLVDGIDARANLDVPAAGPRLARVPGLATLTAVLLGALAWEVTALLSGGWVPSLRDVASSFDDVLADPRTTSNALITLGRIGLCFAAATVLGSAVGTAMGLNRYAEAFFRPLVVIALAIPDPVYVIFAILILGTDPSSGLIALTLAVLPFVITVVHGGVRARDPQLDELAQVYRFGRRRYVVEVLARQVAPSLIVAARTSFAFTWKIVVLVEAISQPLGIGSQIYNYFRLLRYDEMIACALVFIVVMRVIDSVMLGFVERRTLAWNRT